MLNPNDWPAFSCKNTDTRYMEAEPLVMRIFGPQKEKDLQSEGILVITR
jgi:hypothetical protein